MLLIILLLYFTYVWKKKSSLARQYKVTMNVFGLQLFFWELGAVVLCWLWGMLSWMIYQNIYILDMPNFYCYAFYSLAETTWHFQPDVSIVSILFAICECKAMLFDLLLMLPVLPYLNLVLYWMPLFRFELCAYDNLTMILDFTTLFHLMIHQYICCSNLVSSDAH